MKKFTSHIDYWNLRAIECLEAVGIYKPTQAQIDIVEQQLRKNQRSWQQYQARHAKKKYLDLC